jgi:hypothetical protein
MNNSSFVDAIKLLSMDLKSIHKRRICWRQAFHTTQHKASPALARPARHRCPYILGMRCLSASDANAEAVMKECRRGQTRRAIYSFPIQSNGMARNRTCRIHRLPLAI